MNINEMRVLKTTKLFQVAVTPELAEKLIDINYKNNRKLKVAVVDRYVLDMQSHQWDSSIVDPIHIITNKAGEFIVMNNGNHRMHAVVKSGVTIPMWFNLTATEAQYLNMDNGASRNNADYIDTPNANKLVPLAKAIWATINSGNSVHNIMEGRIGNTRPTRETIVNLVRQREEEMLSAVRKAIRMRSRLGHGSYLGYAYWAWVVKWLGIDEALEEYVDDFTEMYSDAITVRAAKQALMPINGAKIQAEKVLGVLTSTYLSFLSGKDVKRIQWEPANAKLMTMIKERLGN